MYMTYMLDRVLTNRIRGGKKSILLLGPRQVGKSTLITSLKPDLTINLADEGEFLSYAKDPGRLKRQVNASPGAKLIVIDEIQRIPPLLNSVQGIMDQANGIKFILTGSSARKLKRGGANLLPGRIILEHLGPLSFWELGTRFDLEKALRIGTLPGIYLDEQEGEEVLGTYAKVYLREEIQAEALIKNVGSYARFLDLAAELSGQWINYSKMASDSEIPKETIRRYLSILEETLLVHLIPSFQPKEKKRRVSQRDRFVFFDLGVRNALLGIHKSRLSPTEMGHLFEQWIILQCIDYNRTHHREWRLSSYRTDVGAEVDLIIDVGKKLIAIECKAGRNASPSWMRGLRSFEEVAHKPVEKWVVFQGEKREKFERGEVVVPYQEFLDRILPKI